MAPGSRARTNSSSPSKAKTTAKAKLRNSTTKSKKAAVRKGENASDTLSGDQGEAYEVSDADEHEYPDSDALDEDNGGSGTAKKRKRADAKKGSTSPKKRRNKDEDDEDLDEDLLDGQTIAGRIVKAPREGQVPPGQISRNTLAFLQQLAKPECNDREWFKLHEAVFRQAEKEWKDWIEEFTPLLMDVDDQIPLLPTKDVIHRIYRDVRFSNDKTPYKKGFSASFSRSGRKGIFAHLQVGEPPSGEPSDVSSGSRCTVMPEGQSLIAAGAWQPAKNELATMRYHIQHHASRLRDIISAPEFVKFFGKASPHPKRERQNVFGHEDELKVAPKGIDKNHRDIDLLKLRSVAVIHKFLDSEVIGSDFKENVCKVLRVMKPLVHCLNDMMTLPVDEDSGLEDAEEHRE